MTVTSHVFIAALVIAAPASAVAQQSAATSSHKQFTGTVAPMAFFPVGAVENIAEPSLGARGSLSFWVLPKLAIVGSVDYTLATKSKDLPRKAELSFYAFDVGARVQTPTTLSIDVFAEALIGRHFMRLAVDGVVGSDSGFGFRLGGGVARTWPGGFSLGLQASYASAHIEDADLDAALVELGIGWSF